MESTNTFEYFTLNSDPILDKINLTRFYNVSGYPFGVRRDYLGVLFNNLQNTTNSLKTFKLDIRSAGLETCPFSLQPCVYNSLDELVTGLGEFNTYILTGDLSDSQFVFLNNE